MNEKFVVNIFWSDGYMKGVKLFVLYNDNTYETFILDFKVYQNKDRVTNRNFMNLRIFRNSKFTQKQVRDYIEQRMKEWEESLG